MSSLNSTNLATTKINGSQDIDHSPKKNNNSDTEDTEDYDSDDSDDETDDDEVNDFLINENSHNKVSSQNMTAPDAALGYGRRTSKITQKLRILPEDKDSPQADHDPEENTLHFVPTTQGDDDSLSSRRRSISKDPSITRKRGKGNEIYSQVSHITDNLAARKDAEKLGKKQRKYLPRVTSYCTAGSYDMKGLIKWIKTCRKTNHTKPKLFDDCLYTPFIYKDWRGDKRANDNNDFIRLSSKGGEIYVSDKQPDLFIFEYGVIVMWGFTEREEKAFLSDLENYEMEKLAIEDVQIENLNYYITKSYQPRIYNDFITLNDGSNYLLKLSISHALAQSVKISLFEELVDNSIEDTQDIPQQIASMGKISMSKEDIMKSIGELFILRININLHGSILDSPEIMWSEPQLEPIYQATRGYLEINQRVSLLNQRLEVISDLLQMFKEQLGQSDEEYLEFIVIVLISVEVLVSVVNIIVDIVADTK
ncbi:related to Sporulation protein RMD1 [Hanseniaspora guilliermondii]|uniref:Related to Sporulation protein RMD1 n=1 Tax=Hanseniaspora guilliermondii TaxID=56406 RepID=A0A1L0B4E6_9ASCO|nr:related to Sporulation protein RMD1 [Hanseniaspora guilliermondii]